MKQEVLAPQPPGPVGAGGNSGPGLGRRVKSQPFVRGAPASPLGGLTHLTHGLGPISKDREAVLSLLSLWGTEKVGSGRRGSTQETPLGGTM